jgi:chromosomal replication initiator protein
MASSLEERLESPLRAALSERLGESRFGLWFGEGVSLGVSGDSVEVGVPNAFFRDWIQGHFARNVVDAAHDVTGRQLRLAFRLDGETDLAAPPLETPASKPGRAKSKAQGVATASLPAPAAPRGSTRPARRLDDFVTGPCNKLAFAAAQEMAANPASAFNPLVIQGGVGLGKTHLIEGVAAALRATRPDLRVVHTTGEAFTNGFLDAMRTGTLNAFRARYRGAGALIVDDVHFIAAKRATQDEFLHTFNALAAEGVPIVLASDQHPRQISKLPDELVTRFLGGMVVRLDAPDPATRKAILKSKARGRGVDIPDSVLSYIADNLRASVRELEGALHSLIAQATLSGKRLDLALAKTALRDTIRHTARAVGLKDVEKAICGLFEMKPDDLHSDGRARAISYPRMIGMYLARKHVGASYSEIGRFFGGRNHSTVISAEKKVKGWLADEARIALLDGFETTGEILASLERALGSA